VLPLIHTEKGKTTSLKRHGRCSIKNSITKTVTEILAVQGMEECVPTLTIILIWASKDAMLIDGKSIHVLQTQTVYSSPE